MKALRITIALVAAALAGLAVSVAVRGPDRVALDGGVLLTQPRLLPPFSLVDHEGQPFGPERLQGRWTVVFSGFTHCPDLCPNTLALLAQAERRLGDAAGRMQVLFVSVDPQRDTPEVLAGYVRYFSPGFVGVTGSAAQLDALMQALGLGYALGDTSQPGYSVDHSASLVLIDPQGRVAGYLTEARQVETLVADLRRVLAS